MDGLTPSSGRKRIGVLVPFTNTTLEPDCYRLKPESASVHFSRFSGYADAGIPDETAMHSLGETDISGPLELINAVRPDIILYGCTSGTLTHGAEFDAALRAKISQTTQAPCITAAGSVVFALKKLGVDQVGFSSPYMGGINEQAQNFLSDHGIKTVSRADIGVALDSQAHADFGPADIVDLALQSDSQEAQALVLLCTDMRSVECIEELEAKTGKPVVAVNQAMMFQAFKELGLGAHRVECGVLFR